MAELRRRMLIRGLVAALGVMATATCQAASSLGSYNVDPASVTVAGLSSGAFMAVQMHVAYSSRIHGAAVFAGGPFYCAQGNSSSALGACMSGNGIPLQSLVDYTNNQAGAGTIDSPSNLSSAAVYLFSGTNDTTVHQPAMDALQQYYQAFSVNNLTYNNNTPAAHSWVSPEGTNSCGSSYSPYINNCNIDPEQTFLTQFYGALNAKNTGTLSGSFVQFDQTPFCSGGSCSAISLDSTGWAYVPQSCANGDSCRLLMVLHGCLQGQGSVGQDLVKKSGLNEWADTNNLIVLYPQVVTSSSNSYGCWDWWGYTSSDYALQSGPQMRTLMAMVDQVTGQAVVTGSSSGTSSGSSSSGGTTGSGACTTLGLSCANGETCCSGSSCQWGLCLPSSTTSGSGSSAGTSTASTASTGSTGSTGSTASTSSSSATSASSGTGTSASASTGSSGSRSSSSGSSGSSASAATSTGTTGSSGSTSSGSSSSAGSSSGSSAAGTSGSTGDLFTPQLALTGITPALGSTLANTQVTLEGTGFVPWAQVLVGSMQVKAVYVQSPAVITGLVPGGLPGGKYDVTVIDPDGSKVVLKKAFTVVEPSGGCTSAPGDLAWLSLLAAGLFGWRGRRGRARLAALAVGVALAGAAAPARAEEETVQEKAVQEKPAAKPAILGPQGAIYVGASVSSVPAAVVGFFPVDHLALTAGLALSFDGNGSAASPLTGLKGTLNSKVGSDLFLDALYFVHDRAPFATGPELNFIGSLAPYGPFTMTVITPMWALRYAPWKAPIAIGTGVGVSFAFIRGMQPIVGLATQGLDIVYAF